MKKLSILLCLLIKFILVTGQITVTVSTAANPPVNRVLEQYVRSNRVTSTLTYNSIDSSAATQAYVFGRLESLTSTLTITTDLTNCIINLQDDIARNLTPNEKAQAFGDFQSGNITIGGDTTGIDPNNIVLPDGTYRICFLARNDNGGSDISNPLLGCSGTFIIASCTQTPNAATINTMIVTPSVNPVISQTIRSGGITSNVAFTNPPGCSTQVKLFGRIERISPSPFSIELNPEFNQQTPVTLMPGSTTLSNAQLINGFNNFQEGDLLVTGIDLASIQDANNNIRLPDGNYKICYYARYFKGSTLGEYASDPNLGCSNFTLSCEPPNAVQIATIVKPPIVPVISQAILNGGIGVRIQTTNQPVCSTQVKLFGKIERLSPSPFTIAVNPDYQQQTAIALNTASPIDLTPAQQTQAFGNLQESNLIIEGIDPSAIKDPANNIKLPDGNYRICFYARYIDSDGQLAGEASNPALGCGTFTICNQAGGAPQFTQPINNLNVTSDIALVRPASPVIFTWTPPQSTCGLPPGGFTYDFEIRELFSNQTVGDALNNPFVFRKTALPSTTFLLDTTLYKNVLQPDRRYAIRVRAIGSNTNLPVEIDNDGYSRIEAFQYGGNLISQNNFYEPQDYYLRFKDRKSAYWDDVLTKYKAHLRKDTLMPLNEYIAFALTQNATAYNLDAIELFLTLNPDLAEVKKVKLSHTPNLPIWPDVPTNDLSNFEKEYQAELEPDKAEENKFLKYLDTLNNYKQKAPDKAVALINDLASHLNNVKTDIDSVDATTVDYINNVLAELLYRLRQLPRNINNNQYNQLQNLTTALKDLTAADPNSTSYLQLFPLQKRSSLTSNVERKNVEALSIASLIVNEINGADNVLAVIAKQLRPFNVVVYRNSKDPPYKPVLDAPDLTGAYRIFYTLTDLYNHKNPAVNAKSSTRLASTVQVPLPSNTVFTFWTSNMLNHKTTKAQDVDLKNVMIQTSKIVPDAKKLTIVLKVD